MWDLLNVSIPAAALVPLMAVMSLAWFFFQQNAKSSDIRKAEFRRLQRMAMEEHQRAERELENEYMRHSKVDSNGGGVSFRGLGAPSHGYGISGVDRHDVGRGDWIDSEGESRKRSQAVKVEFSRRNGFDEDLRKSEPETENRYRREFIEEDLKKRQSEEELEWQRRKADLEAQAKREAEEERRRRAPVDDGKAWEEQEPDVSPRHAQSVSNLNCVVCQKPTKRRCSRCKSISYCSRECQVKHWSEEHKYQCQPLDAGTSPRSSTDDDA